jgi:hypothetical protein
MTATLQFDNSPRQQAVREALTDYLKFRTSVTIPAASIATVTVDAPAWLGGEFQGRTLTLDGTFPPGVEQAPAVLFCVRRIRPVRHVITKEATGRSPPCAVIWTLVRSRPASGLGFPPIRDEGRRCAARWYARYAAGQDSNRANGYARRRRWRADGRARPPELSRLLGHDGAERIAPGTFITDSTGNQKFESFTRPATA